MPKVWPVHYVLGIAGIAVIRNWLAGGETAKQCADQLSDLTRRFADDPRLNFQIDIPDLESRSGYSLWADTYDDLHNPLIETEQPIIRSVVDSVPAGRALDAACGTGRYARYLASRGYQVAAIDLSSHMIDRAREAAPAVRYSLGSIEALPYADASFDLVTCGLALTHLPKVAAAISEFGRVLRPGGRAIVADHHPMAGMLGGSAIFRDKDGFYRNVTSYVHTHAEYLSAFRAADLKVLDCIEPALDEEQASKGVLFRIAPEAFNKGAVGLPFALIWHLER